MNNIKHYCPNCGRELEDGELSYGIDGCMYCLNMFEPEENRKKAPEPDAVSGLIILIFYIAFFAFLAWILSPFLKPLFD